MATSSGAGGSRSPSDWWRTGPDQEHTRDNTHKEEEGTTTMSKINNWMLNKMAAYKTRDEEGQGLAEYGLILALIAVVCIVALQTLGTGISGKIGSINSAL
jgi:pilus assembly protein Flp/PilA